MRILKFAIAMALAIPFSANAQQRTTGDIISENFNRGRQMREAMDARRERAAEAARRERAAKEEAAFRAAQQEVTLARNNPSLVLRSKNGLPDIRLSDSPVSLCAAPTKAAFTSTTDGKSVFGCASLTQSHLEVNWAEFGKRNYDLSEWEQKASGNADHVPLGG